MNNDNQFLECKECGVRIQVHTRLRVRPDYPFFTLPYCPHCLKDDSMKEISSSVFYDTKHVLYTRVKRLYTTANHIKKAVELSLKFRC